MPVVGDFVHLRFAVLCSAMQCIVLCSAMQCYAVLCSAMQCYAVLCSAMQCYAVLCSAMHRSVVPRCCVPLIQFKS
jgi:hypothetical protein